MLYCIHEFSGEWFFMWTKTRSLMLSRIAVTGFTAAMVMLTFFVPYFAEWYEGASQGVGLIGGSVYLPVMMTLYASEICGMWAIIELHILLHNIRLGEVFVPRNTKCLRCISWACMLAGLAFAVMGLWKFLFLLPAFFAVMFGLIMRVLKNVFERAVELKSENDFTI